MLFGQNEFSVFGPAQVIFLILVADNKLYKQTVISSSGYIWCVFYFIVFMDYFVDLVSWVVISSHLVFP